jgi:tetratricopeptide (TPR) repeat protein
MSRLHEKLSKFWNELKQRKVLKALAMYAGSAFIILQVSDIVLPRWGLPAWFLNLIILLLIIGFIVTAILAWIFDITPGGIKKTVSEEKVDESTSTAKKRRDLQVSDVIIAGLLVAVLILLYPKIFARDKFKEIRNEDGKLSIAVMPFRNISGDSIYNFWQEGLQNLLITSLSNSEQLSVRQYETMLGIFNKESGANYASLTPSHAREVAQKLDANSVITGNIYKYDNKVRITANLLDAVSEKIYKSFEVDGTTEDDFFSLTDSLSFLVMNFLEIRNLKENLFFDLKQVMTGSTEAYKLFLHGYSCHSRLDYESAIKMYNRAIEIDSNFISAMISLAYCYGDIKNAPLSKRWAYKAFEKIDRLPRDMQLSVLAIKAVVDKEPLDQIKYCKQYIEIHPQSITYIYTIGWTYFNLKEWEKCIPYFEEDIKLFEKIGQQSWAWTYILLGISYHHTGQHKKEHKIFEAGKELWEDQKSDFDYWQAICAVSRGDSTSAAYYLSEIQKAFEQKAWSTANLQLWFAGVYENGGALENAEFFYRKALSLNNNSATTLNNFAHFLLTNDITFEEGITLVRRALEQEPENAVFQTTYGLALYKKGKLEESLEVLEKAWDLKPFYDHEHYMLIKKLEELAQIPPPKSHSTRN